MMLDDVVNKEIAPWRFSAWVFALFAGLAFALAMLGLFSLVSLDVANRRREFAIRMAVGATGRHIVSGVFRSAARRAGIGIAGGLLGGRARDEESARACSSACRSSTCSPTVRWSALVAIVVAARLLPARATRRIRQSARACSARVAAKLRQPQN